MGKDNTSTPARPAPDFIDDVVLKMGHDINADRCTFHRSPAWPGNALAELDWHYRQAIQRQAAATVQAMLEAAGDACDDAFKLTGESSQAHLYITSLYDTLQQIARKAKAEGGDSK